MAASTHRGGLRERILRAAGTDPAATHDQIAQRVGCHPSTVGKHLRGRSGGPAGGVSGSAAADVSLRPQKQSAVSDVGQNRPRQPQAAGRGSGRVDPGQPWPAEPAAADVVLDAVAAHPSLNVRLAVVGDLHATAELVARFVDDPHSLVRLSVARHRNATPALLEQLAGDVNAQVRAAVASHPSTPQAAVALLAADPDGYVQIAVARHAHVDALEAVPADADEAVQTALTQRRRLEQRKTLHDPQCPPETVAAAAAPGQSYEMRALAAAHPNVPADVLARLLKDPTSLTVRCAAVSNPDCPPDLVSAAAAHKRPQVRAGAASNPNCPAGTLTELAADGDIEVRYAAARNVACPDSCWEMLSRDADPAVRHRAARHCPAESLRHFAESGPSAIKLVLQRADCPADLLTRLADHPSPYYRVGVACHPNCPPEILDRLAQDAEQRVAERAAAMAASRKR